MSTPIQCTNRQRWFSRWRYVYTCLFRVEPRQTGNLFPLLFNHLPRLCCCVYRFATFLRTRESPVPIVGEETLMFCLFDIFRICKKSGFEYNEMGSSQSHEVFDLLGSTWSVVGCKPGSVNSGDDPQEEGSRSYRRRQESVRTVSVGLCSYYYATQSWCHRSDEDCRKEGRSNSGWNVENDRHVTQTDSQEPHSGEGGDASDALWL